MGLQYTSVNHAVTSFTVDCCCSFAAAATTTATSRSTSQNRSRLAETENFHCPFFTVLCILCRCMTVCVIRERNFNTDTADGVAFFAVFFYKCNSFWGTAYEIFLEVLFCVCCKTKKYEGSNASWRCEIELCKKLRIFVSAQKFSRH